MNLEERLALLGGLTKGGMRDLAGLTAADVGAVSHFAAAAFQSKKFEISAKAFAALAALEPDSPLHLVHLAHALAGQGDKVGAVEAIDRFLAQERPGSAADMVRALMLRAELVAGTDRVGAENDLKAAHIIAAGSPLAQQILAGSAP